MTSDDVERLRGAWASFSRGDIDAAADVLAPDVRWYGAGEPDAEGACHGRDEAMAFIRRSVADGVTAELLELRVAGGDRVVAVVETHTPPDWEGPEQPHGEVMTIQGGKVTEIVVYPTVGDALLAVGLEPD